MADPDLDAIIEQTLIRIAPGDPVTPAGDPCPAQLDDLFRTLREADEGFARAEAEDLIWALWCAHEDEAARRAMHKAIGIIARRELDDAKPLLDELVREWPRWAEAWNKRATLLFLLERDLESARDVQRTLALEPRHFGALSGLGRICLRAGDEVSALVAFEQALRWNPHLDRIRRAARDLRARVARSVH